MLRIRNPNNPFHGDTGEEVKYSVEKGCLTLGEVDTPRTAFHFIRRSNRASKGENSRANIRIERENAEALRILNMADVTTAIRAPSTMVAMSKHISNCLETDANECDLTNEEKLIVEQAIYRLKTTKEEYEESIEIGQEAKEDMTNDDW